MHNQPRKIIHIDMDCFYAAIEIRDRPELIDKPVAVGGSAELRGVLCTCNYIARQYGVRSAMATSTALRLCPDLILLPVDMQKYKKVADNIQQIFYQFTDLVEPLSLDEAYLDVSHAKIFDGSATLIAKKIRELILGKENLIASAGIAPNKFLAKIASGWKKPNGFFVIRPEEVTSFIKKLAVKELFGVGKVTAEKLEAMNLYTCEDLQRLSLKKLIDTFGKFGIQLYEQCRGYDAREVSPHRTQKSLSVEHTFPQDITNRDLGLAALKVLYQKLLKRRDEQAPGLAIKNQFIKIKFNNFRQITAEEVTSTIHYPTFEAKFLDAYAKVKLPIRLIGIGIHFKIEKPQEIKQLSLLDF